MPTISALLTVAGLYLHNTVTAVTLHGSRGPQGGARHDSDLDLCLVVGNDALAASADPEMLLRSVLADTLRHWTSEIELDLAAVYDKSHCGLRCLNETGHNPDLCPTTVDCMGLSKTQEGFDGFVTGPAIDCSKMYPLWSKHAAQ